MFLVSALQQSESIIPTYISILFRFCSHVDHFQVLSRVPCAIQQFLLVIYFIYSSVYMSILSYKCKLFPTVSSAVVILIHWCHIQTPACLSQFWNTTSPHSNTTLLCSLSATSLKLPSWSSMSHSRLSFLNPIALRVGPPLCKILLHILFCVYFPTWLKVPVQQSL